MEIVLIGLRGDVTVKELCRSHEIAETLSARATPLVQGRTQRSRRARYLFCELTTSRGYETGTPAEHPRSHADIIGTELPTGLQGKRDRRCPAVDASNW